MKAIKLASIGITVLVALAVVISLTTSQIDAAHASSANRKQQAEASPTSSAANMPANVPANMPASIRVPAGNTFLFAQFGHGVLTYACPITAMSVESPMIILSNQQGGRSTGTHYAINNGLYWENLTGNAVVATPLVKIPSPVNPQMNAPWVLLKAQAHIGMGQFNRVTFIQRILTNGGLPNAANCKAGQTEQSSPFSLLYLFYGAV
jgi:hypothetical protein